jgi:hypothetical protein
LEWRVVVVVETGLAEQRARLVVVVVEEAWAA